MPSLYPNMNPTSTECSMLVMGIKSIGRLAEIHPVSPRLCSTADRVFWLLPGLRGGCLIHTSIASFRSTESGEKHAARE